MLRSWNVNASQLQRKAVPISHVFSIKTLCLSIFLQAFVYYEKLKASVSSPFHTIGVGLLGKGPQETEHPQFYLQGRPFFNLVQMVLWYELCPVSKFDRNTKNKMAASSPPTSKSTRAASSTAAYCIIEGEVDRQRRIDYEELEPARS